jgi:uncharacterized coiled-coil protein SlyX
LASHSRRERPIRYLAFLADAGQRRLHGCKLIGYLRGQPPDSFWVGPVDADDFVSLAVNTIRIGGDVGFGSQTRTFVAGIFGAPVAGVTVLIDSTGQLGVLSSSQRFKDEIKPMDTASEVILALRPVTFRYKHEIDPNGILQFGPVAEEVEKVDPGLVIRDAQGKVFTVRYDAVNAMLLNEFLKEHRTMEELKATIGKQEATITELKAGIKALTASLKKQESQIEKVSAKLELSKPAPRTAAFLQLNRRPFARQSSG